MNSTPAAEPQTVSVPATVDWRILPPAYSRLSLPPRKTLFLSTTLFLLTFFTCLVAGTQFAIAYSQNQAVSLEGLLHSLSLSYRHPSELLAGLPFAVTLLVILLAHELGHFFACRHHRIYCSYPFFIPFPSIIGTFGAFIFIRSPFRTRRALFDVGASGPFAGFLIAFPALLYGLANSNSFPACQTYDSLTPSSAFPCCCAPWRPWFVPASRPTICFSVRLDGPPGPACSRPPLIFCRRASWPVDIFFVP